MVRLASDPLVEVLLIDGHPIVIDGLDHLLGVKSHFLVIGRAQSLSEARVILEHIQPDLILMEVRLRDSQGLDTIRAVRLVAPHAKIVVLTEARGLNELEARGAGADALLGKEASSNCLLQSLLEWFPNGQASERAMLTDCERRVARLVSEGMTNCEIGRALFISENTVKTHLAHVLTKLHLHHRAALARHWAEQGLNGSRSE
jgi:DNA-binding NarL/FixJ family response regulator